MRTLLKIVAAFGLLTNGDKTDAEVLAKLSKSFDFQRDAIVTAHVKFKIMRTGRTVKLGADEVRQLVEGLPLRSVAVEMQQLSDRLIEHNPGSDHLPLLPGELFIDGKKVAERYGDAGLQEATVDADELILRNPRNNQITKTRTGSYSPVTLNVLRFVPPKLDLLAAGYAICDRSSGRIAVRSGPNYMEIDESSGFVHRFVQSTPAGDVLNETWQLKPTHYAGDIVFPEATVTARYSANQLAILVITVVEDATFNRDQSAEIYQVAVKKGDTVVDAFSDPNKPAAFRAATASPSVDKAIEDRQAALLAVDSGKSALSAVMLCVTIAIITGIVFFLWPRPGAGSLTF